jgi:hypothetical protein
VGVRINGNWSRNLPQKSLRLYFDHHGDPEDITDDFFGQDEEHRRLILRCASRHVELFLKDPMSVEIFADLGHPVCRWRPVEVYLQDEYWGLYHLRERPDDEWAQHTLGLDGDFNLIKDYEGQGEDDFDQWASFLDAVAAWPDPEANSFYLFLEQSLDLTSYLDWVLYQAWSASADNGGQRNLVILRPEGGRWQVLIYDQDAILHGWNLSIDYFRFFTSATSEEFDARRPPAFYQSFNNCERMFGLFRQAMSNPRVRRACRERWRLLTDEQLTVARTGALLEAIAAANEPGIDNHDERWPLYIPQATMVDQIRSHVQTRNGYAAADFAQNMDTWMDDVELDVFTATGGDDAVSIVWHCAREIEAVGWEVERRSPGGAWEEIASYLDDPMLESQGGPDAEADYAIVDDAVTPDEPVEYRLVYVDTGGRRVAKPWM